MPGGVNRKILRVHRNNRCCEWESFRGEAAAHEIDEGLDGEFHEEEGLGDEIVAAAHGGIGAAFEIGKTGDENNGGGFVALEGTELGAKLKAVHARHVHVEKDEVPLALGKKVHGDFGAFKAGAGQL